MYIISNSPALTQQTTRAERPIKNESMLTKQGAREKKLHLDKIILIIEVQLFMIKKKKQLSWGKKGET